MIFERYNYIFTTLDIAHGRRYWGSSRMYRPGHKPIATSSLKGPMMKTSLSTALLLGSLLASTGIPTIAADQDRDRDHQIDQDRQRLQQQDRIDGWNLMTEQERQQYRERMQHLETQQERERFRDQQHELMMQRMREQPRDMPRSQHHQMHNNAPRSSGGGQASPGSGGDRGKH